MNEQMMAYINQGLCPCGCKRPVPHNRFWATNRCARRMNKKGVTMPHRYEPIRSKFHGNGRRPYVPVSQRLAG